jgi:hypothetical protein
MILLLSRTRELKALRIGTNVRFEEADKLCSCDDGFERLSAPRRAMCSFAQSFSSTITSIASMERDNHGAPQRAWKNDRMEPSRIESALASARWALCCFFISTPGAID